MRPGDVIAGRYRLEEVLGEGGMGVVWRAWQLGVERRVALKLLKGADDPSATARLLREARAMGELHHRHFPDVYEVGEHDGAPFVAMEWLSGCTVSELRGTPQPIELVVDLAAQLADALTYAHGRGIVHRDLKPENLFLVGGATAPLNLKVLDLGLVKLVDVDITNLTQTSEVFGTAAYMSPEQLRGSRDAGPETDLYAVGVMLYELIEGRLPFGGGSFMEIGMAHLTAPIPRLGRSECPPWLAETVRSLLAKDARDRLPSARALAQAVETGRTPRRTRGFVAPAIGTALLVLGLVVLFVTTRSEPLPPPRPASAQGPVSAPLLRQPPPAPAPAPDTEEAAPKAPPTSGCDQPAPFTRFGALDGLFPAYVPASYTTTSRHPLVILLHNRDTDPQRAMLERFQETADAHGLVLVAPASTGTRAWDVPDLAQHLALIRLAAQAAAAELCIDHSRVFAVGHAAGGWIADRLSCAPWITAVATYSFAYDPTMRFCEPTLPKPYLMLAPTQSQHEPLRGGAGCKGRERVAIGTLTDMWRDRNQCTTRGPTEPVGASRCWSYACEAGLRVCHVEGGHQWPGAPPRAPWFNEHGCDGPPGDSTFDAAAEIWRFFAAAPALPREAWFQPGTE